MACAHGLREKGLTMLTDPRHHGRLLAGDELEESSQRFSSGPRSGEIRLTRITVIALVRIALELQPDMARRKWAESWDLPCEYSHYGPAIILRQERLEKVAFPSADFGCW